MEVLMMLWFNPGLMTPGTSLVFGGFFLIVALIFYLVLRRIDDNDHEL